MDDDTFQRLFLFTFYAERDMYSLPKGYIDKLIPFLKKNHEIISKEAIPKLKRDLTFQKELRPEQVQLLAKWGGGSGMVVARAGFGKTVVASKLIETYGVRTLILVPTIRILQQWKESLNTFLDCRPGIIASGVFDYDKDIVVASHKSLLKADKLDLVKKRFGLILVDECHKAPAPKLMSIINSMYAKYRIGFTATPYRKDLKHFHLEGIFGNTVIEHKSDYIKAKVNILQTDFIFPFGGMSDYNDALSSIARNQEFNSLVVNTIKSLYEKGRHIIVVTPRLEHIEVLMKKLTVPCGHIVSEKNQNDRDCNTDLLNSVFTEDRSVLFGTNGLVGTGFDLAVLDTLILPYSFNNKGELLQIVGRIERQYPDKLSPQVFHFFFKNRLITANQQTNTLGFYKELGHDVYIDSSSLS